jgi:lactate dehydrogenase-like 2-hydroxyacid dehydrogenase
VFLASIAEYAITQIMALCKNTHKSYVMTKKADFDITSLECLLLENKICGIIGTGIIGKFIHFFKKYTNIVQ